MKHVVIDADILLFKTAIGNCVDVCWNMDEYDDIYTSTININVACAELDQTIQDILRITQADNAVLVLSSILGSFRHDIYTEYKHNRAFKRKPTGYYKLKEYLLDNYQCFEEPHLEGDDLLGILATGNKLDGEVIIWSEDKDLKTIPCILFKFIKGDMGQPVPTVQEITDKEAVYNFLYQTLIGDTTDGYIGCRGIGGTKATEILKDFDINTVWDVIVATYIEQKVSELVKEEPEYIAMTSTKAKKEYKDNYTLDAAICKEVEDFAISQARCARILRAKDYDWDKKQFKLWSPKKRVY